MELGNEEVEIRWLQSTDTTPWTPCRVPDPLNKRKLDGRQKVPQRSILLHLFTLLREDEILTASGHISGLPSSSSDEREVTSFYGAQQYKIMNMHIALHTTSVCVKHLFCYRAVTQTEMMEWSLHMMRLVSWLTRGCRF